MPEDSNWKTPVASPRASISYVLRSSSGIFVDVEPAADELDGLVDDVEVAQAEEVHLEEAERLDVLHRELRHDLLVGALLLQRQVLGQRAVADHDAGRVDRVLADEALERLREVDDLAHDLVARRRPAFSSEPGFRQSSR